METGTYISGLGHVAVIGWAIIGGSLFNAETKPQAQVTDVTVISSAAFDAMVSRAPDAAMDVNKPQSPDQTNPLTKTPNADVRPEPAKVKPPVKPSKAEPKPNLAEVKSAPKTKAQIEAPKAPDQPTTDQVGATLILPSATIADTDQSGRKQPDKLAMAPPKEQAAPKISDSANPKPDTDAQKSPDTTKATTKDAAAKEPVKPTEEQAPDQSSTEIITEAKKQNETVAPVKSSRPKGRPADLSDKAQAAKDIELAMAEAVKDSGAGTTTPVTPRVAPQGPTLTGSEIEGLRLAVKECWNVGSMSTDAMKVIVVVGVALGRDGKPDMTSIRLISSSGGTGSATTQAYETARRAVIRCGAKGFDLPAEKYDHWRDVEITFNPEKMRNK